MPPRSPAQPRLHESNDRLLCSYLGTLDDRRRSAITSGFTSRPPSPRTAELSPGTGLAPIGKAWADSGTRLGRSAAPQFRGALHTTKTLCLQCPVVCTTAPSRVMERQQSIRTNSLVILAGRASSKAWEGSLDPELASPSPIPSRFNGAEPATERHWHFMPRCASRCARPAAWPDHALPSGFFWRALKSTHGLCLT